MFFHFFKQYKLFLTALVATIFLTACGSSDSFTISGEIEGLGTRNLRFFYNDGNSVKIGLASAIDSKFRFEGHSKNPTIVTITTGQRNVLGSLEAQNGDDINIVLSAQDPYKMKVDGNTTSKEYAEFVTVNSETLAEGNPTKINELVANYINKFPKRRSATLIMTTFYDSSINPVEADSLLTAIDSKARPANFIAGFRDLIQRVAVTDSTDTISPITLFCEKDSLTTVNPVKYSKTIFSFITGVTAMDDSIKSFLKDFENDKNIKIVNVYLDNDTAMWKANLRKSLPPGLNTWTTGSVASPRLTSFNLHHLPAFAVVDSTSTIIYKGLSISQAIQTLK